MKLISHKNVFIQLRKKSFLLLTTITVNIHLISCGQKKNTIYEGDCQGKKFTIQQIVLLGFDQNQSYYEYELNGHPAIKFGDRKNVQISGPIKDIELLKDLDHVELDRGELITRTDSSTYMNDGSVLWLSPKTFSRKDFEAYKNCFVNLKQALNKNRRTRTNVFTPYITGLIYADIEDHTINFRNVRNKDWHYKIKPDGQIIYQYVTNGGSIEKGYGGAFDANIKYPEKAILLTNKNLGLSPKLTIESMKDFRTDNNNKTFEDYFKVVEVKTDTMQLTEFKSTLAETTEHYFIVSLKNKQADIFEYNFDRNIGKIIVDRVTYSLTKYNDDGTRYNFKNDDETVMVICDHVFGDNAIEKSWPDILHSIRIYVKGKDPWPLEFSLPKLKAKFKNNII